MHKVIPIVTILLFPPTTSSAEAAPGTASSQDTEAEALIREGIELRRLSDDRAALAKFEAAVKLDASPRAVAQLGLCELAVGRFSQAVEHLTAAMHATKDKWVASKKAILRESLEQAKARVGRVEVKADPVGSEVFINGERVGASPLADSVVTNEGSVDVQVRKDGFEPQSRSLSLKGGQYQNIAITLEPTKPRVVAPAPTSTPETSSDGALGDATSPARPKWIAPTKWTLLGAAGVSAAVGTYGWLQHQSLVGSYDDAGCQVSRQGEPGFVGGNNTFTVTEDCTNRFAKIDGAKTLRLIGFVAGGVFLAGYVALAVLDKPSSTEKSMSQTSTMKCAVGVASIGCAGSFDVDHSAL